MQIRVTTKNLFKKRKDRFRRWRDLSIFATVAVYALSVIDAYVDASLSNFDISDDLSLHISPVLLNTIRQLQQLIYLKVRLLA